MIFVFVRGDPEFLFGIAVARGFCVGRTRMSARSCRACIGLDRRSTFWRSRRRVSGTVGCPSRVSSGSPIWTASRPRPGSTLALAMEEFCSTACGRYGSLLRCRVRPTAVQPREGGRLGLKQQHFRSHLMESELLPGLHPSRIPVHGTLDFSFFDEILHRTFIFCDSI